MVLHVSCVLHDTFAVCLGHLEKLSDALLLGFGVERQECRLIFWRSSRNELVHLLYLDGHDSRKNLALLISRVELPKIVL